VNNYILDACALIALLQDEPGADEVAAAINAANKGKVAITMHKINFLEVYYDVYRSRGKEQADFMTAELKKRPVLINPEISDAIFTDAGRLKATYRISLADAIALAQTKVLDGELMTADHHEFDVIEKREPVRIKWIR